MGAAFRELEGNNLARKALQGPYDSHLRIGGTMSMINPPPPAPETFPATAPAAVAVSKAS